jgi:mRNA interferase MazF
MIIERGDIFLASLNPAAGAKQTGVRPVLVVQNDQTNKFIPTVTVVPLTSNLRASRFLFTVLISAAQLGLPQDSVALAFQIRTLDKSCLIRKAGHFNTEQMAAVDRALNIHPGLK